MTGTLGWLALSRGTIDRVSDRRRDEQWLARAWADPHTRVLVVEQGDALVRVQDTPALVLVSPAEAPPGERYLLGVDDGDVAYFAVDGPLPAVDGAEAGTLRRVGALLSDRDSGLLVHAVALHNWHSTHRYCPRCGTRTKIADAGASRLCPNDGSEHFPRVDPAVIMLVHDDDDRMLLARNPAWAERRVSVLAGFVEPGESLEHAVAREVAEEVGLAVSDIRYLGSQPWPLPQSLMIGYFCRAGGDQELHVDEIEIETARWYTRDELRAAVVAGDILLPGKISIARHLIEHWYGGELPGSWGL
ncbi:MAG TPA: NAD(+) diphosphatase [Streptosporangiaceae bacterium]